MKWSTFISTLLGALITYSAILFTNELDLRKRKRAHEELIHALFQGLQDEIVGLLEMAKSAVRPMGALPEGKPYEALFASSQDYFTVYHANAALVIQIEDPELRRSIIRTYTRAKGLLDMANMNRLYLERYHYLQSTFYKTKEISIQTEFEDYFRSLVQIAGQLKRADAEFQAAATRLLKLLAQKTGAAPYSTHTAGRQEQTKIISMERGKDHETPASNQSSV